MEFLDDRDCQKVFPRYEVYSLERFSQAKFQQNQRDFQCPTVAQSAPKGYYPDQSMKFVPIDLKKLENVLVWAKTLTLSVFCALFVKS